MTSENRGVEAFYSSPIAEETERHRHREMQNYRFVRVLNKRSDERFDRVRATLGLSRGATRPESRVSEAVRNSVGVG